MKAVLCKAFGPPDALAVEEVPELVPGPGQVIVGVRACGVNFPDALMVQGKYQFKPDFPFSPGGEVAGTVLRLGPEVEGVRVGDRVVAFTSHGGFAEEVAADADRLIPMPDGMDFEHASAFVMTYGTALHALKDRGRIRPGETLLVLGAAGGVGTAAIELGKAFGARVVAAASTDEKLALCRECGADETINYAREDLRQRLRDLAPRGLDLVFDPVGGPYSEPALRAMGWDGRFLVIGFAAGEIPRIPLNLALLKSCSIVGVFWGAFLRRDRRETAAHLADLVRLHAQGKLRPHVSAAYGLEDAAKALTDMLERRVKGKVVIVP